MWPQQLTDRHPMTSTNYLSLIADETNKYSDQYTAVAPRPFTQYTVFLQWKPVTVEGMKVQIALLMTMGLVAKPEVCSHWLTDPDIAAPFFNTCMSCKRFEQILQFLHTVDSTEQPEQDGPQRDKLLKI